MGKNFNTAMTDANKDEWLTPRYITDALGEFDLDVCEPIGRPDEAPALPWIGKHGFHEHGLEEEWFGRVWCNPPPYGKETFKWLAKLAEHGSGIALIFARTETRGFHSEIWQKAHALFFFKGRLSFYHVTGEKGGTSNAPSCLVSYSAEDTQAIALASLSGDIEGKLVFLRGAK